MPDVTFPKNFLFGAGICDYQHFGGSTCDLPSIPAAKHALYFEEDFRLLEELKLNALRTSIEWARIEPEENKIDENSVRFYHEYFSKLKKIGAKTIVTLHHFTNPKWVHNYGGWLSEKTVEKFLKYVDFVSQEFDENIDYYVTINEPTIYSQLAYEAAERGLPPFHRNRKEVNRCLENMNEAIRRSYEIIHENSKKAKVGVANDTSILQPWRRMLRWSLSRLAPELVIESPIEKWEGKYDFCGINYYCKMSSGKPVPYPEGLRKICRDFFEKFKKPVLITENGLANKDDRQRTAYLLLHLKSLNDAVVHDKANVIGYCWWSFLHGYEWGLGYKPFFALVDVDISDSYRRTPTQTAHAFTKIIENNGFSLELLKENCDSLMSPLRFEDWL
jgi:beta-glucosidase